MSTNLPRSLLRIAYEEAAEAYLRSLPPEHFMEATPQATQREITVESLALVRARRPEIHYFNELLVQYPVARQRQPGQVVPDNMVVVSEEPVQASGSFDLPFQPAAPFLVMEYVSKRNKRKDYEDNFLKYERELKVPYYLVFYPDNQELTLYHRRRGKYVSVKPNEHERYAIPELDLEVTICDGWVRYWYRGQLLPLPADLLRDLEAMTQQANALQQRAEAAEQELAQLRAQLEQLQARPKGRS
jgi:Uma2 family endonuclease